ncbi:MAG: YbaB/EbfC family nucleoid-associated protein [Patescibacteria group bacterium]|nr:YbaB/EbfC family nucleoid-associated protein [Patescibacteria group bacterium]
MFDKFKQLKDLQKQGKELQRTLADEFIDIEKNGIKIKMNGNMEIINIEISNEDDKEKLANNLKKIINDAIKQSQKMMAQKMMQGNFNIPGL